MTTKQPSETLIEGLFIAGNRYNVLVIENHMNKGHYIVTATECIGRWSMSRCETGDKWLDAKLAMLANERMFTPW